MRIILYLTFISLIILCLSSCSKGDVVKEPRFGKISISDATVSGITVIEGGDHQFKTDGTAVSLVSGKNRFRFYQTNVLLLDTSLSVEPYTTHTYLMFKSNQNAGLKIFDSSLNGLNKEPVPESGSVKFSLANFSSSLPDKVNIYVSTTTYTPNSNKPIQVGEFLNVSSAFSAFHTIIVGIDESSKPQTKFTLTIKDPYTTSVLATVLIDLPLGTIAGTTDKLNGSVYLLYINDKGIPSILMSK